MGDNDNNLKRKYYPDKYFDNLEKHPCTDCNSGKKHSCADCNLDKKHSNAHQINCNSDKKYSCSNPINCNLDKKHSWVHPTNSCINCPEYVSNDVVLNKECLIIQSSSVYYCVKDECHNIWLEPKAVIMQGSLSELKECAPASNNLIIVLTIGINTINCCDRLIRIIPKCCANKPFGYISTDTGISKRFELSCNNGWQDTGSFLILKFNLCHFNSDDIPCKFYLTFHGYIGCVKIEGKDDGIYFMDDKSRHKCCEIYSKIYMYWG